MNLDRAIMYPYDGESTHILRYQRLIKNINIVGVISPNGWGLVGKDAGFADGGNNIGIEVLDNFIDITADYDTILIIDSRVEINFESMLLSCIRNASEKVKKIVCIRKLSHEQYNCILDLCTEKRMLFSYIQQTSRKYNNVTNEEIVDIKVPVVFVVGQAKQTQKFDIQLKLREDMFNMGYKVSQIGTKHYCEMFGFRSFPDFMYNSNINESSKIVIFNRLIKTIEINEKPDIIIIGIPEGIMPISKYFGDGFGVMAYVVSQAVKPDVTILSLLCNKYNNEYLEELNLLFKYRYGYELDCINVSNTIFDFGISEEHKKKHYITVDIEFINRKIMKCVDCSIPMFNVLDEGSKSGLGEYVVDILGGNESIEDFI